MMPITMQEWIVAIIVFLCIIEIVRRAIRFFRSSKNNNNPCANCVSECVLKPMLDAKQRKCKKSPQKGNKKCCG